MLRLLSKHPSDRPLSAAAVAEVLEAVAPDEIQLGEPAPGEPPFKGLEYYDVEDAEIFFGREALVERLIYRLRDERFLAVIVGASGSGKSSVARAGLVPALSDERDGDWSFRLLTPTEHPLEALAKALIPSKESEAETAPSPEDLANDPAGLQRAAGCLVETEGVRRLLLIVDQLEEIFTLCRDEAERVAFIDNLLTAADREKTGPTVVVITLRADFYPHCATYPALREALARNQEYIGPMNTNELRRAIEEPALRGGWKFQSGLVDLMLRDVRGEPGALPLLSHALLETWKRRSRRTLTLRGYAKAGGVRRAIARSAEQVYNQELSQKQRGIARNVFLRLTELGEGTEDTRRRVAHTELIPEPGQNGTTEQVLATLAEARLITLSEEHIEVAHEALIREWPRLREWLDADRDGLRIHRHLTEAAQAWAALNRDPGELYRGGRLVQALEWSDEQQPELNPLEREFLDASQALAEKREAEREAQLKRLRRRAIYLAGALVAAVGLAIIAVSFGRQASDSAAQADLSLGTAQAANTEVVSESNFRATAESDALEGRAEAESEAQARATAQAEAEDQRHAARVQASIGLSSQAELELQGSSPELAVLLALEALDNYPYTWQAERALGEAVFSNHLQFNLQHESYINTANWSPDQTQILTSSDDETARLWDAQAGSLLFTFEPDDWVGRWSPSGDQFLTVAEEEGTATINVWNANTVEMFRSIPLERNTQEPFERNTQGVVEWSRDGSQILVLTENENVEGGGLRIFDVQTGDLVFAQDASAWWVAWSPSGDRILTLDHEGGFQIWDAATGEVIHQVHAYSEWIGVAEWSPSGDRVFTTDQESSIEVWDSAGGSEILSFEVDTGIIWAARWSPSGEHIVSAGHDGTARVWDAHTGEEIVRFEQHTSTVWDAAWSPSGEYVVSGGRDAIAYVWDSFTGEIVQTFYGHNADIQNVIWSPDGNQILTLGFDLSANVWNLASETELLQIAGAEGADWSLSWSPDGNRLARTSFDGSVEIYDTHSGTSLAEIKAHPARISFVEFSPSGEFVVTTSEDGSAKVIDAFTGAHISTFEGHDGNPFLAEWSPDGGRIATTNWDGDRAVRVWDPMTGEEQLVFSNHSGMVIGARWSPDGSRIASSSLDGEALIWDSVNGEVQLSLNEENSFGIWATAWSPDGKRFATHAQDSVLRIWDAHTGEELIATPGHPSQLAAMSWLPSGDRLISGDTNGVYKMFDTASGAEVFSARVPNFTDLVLSPDGTRFATSSVPGGPLKIFSIWGSLDELIERARDCCILRELTPEEREQFGLPLGG
jgi:WD40 repeat protein